MFCHGTAYERSHRQKTEGQKWRFKNQSSNEVAVKKGDSRVLWHPQRWQGREEEGPERRPKRPKWPKDRRQKIAKVLHITKIVSLKSSAMTDKS